MTRYAHKMLMKVNKFYRELFEVPEEEINFDSFIKFPLLIFRMLLIDFIPLSENATLRMKLKYYAKKLFNCFCMIFCVISTIQIIAYGVNDSGNFEVVVRTIADASTMISILLKFSAICLRKNDIWTIFEGLKTLMQSGTKFNHYYKTKTYLRGYQRLTKVYAWSTLTWYFIVVMTWLSYLANGKIFYLTNLWYPFDAYSVKMYPIAQTWLCFLIYLGFMGLTAFDTAIYALVTVISMEFDFLKHNLMNMKIISKEEIVKLIEHHIKLFELSDKMKQICEPTFLYNFVISSFILCIGLFQLLIVTTDFYTSLSDIMYLLTTAGQIWLVCYFGQKLIDSSARVADGIYECDWINHENSEFRKYVTIIMLRAQRPKTLTAMGFTDISLETFAAVR